MTGRLFTLNIRVDTVVVAVCYEAWPPSDPAPRPATPFETFVSAIVNVPKAEADAVREREAAEPRTKRGPKPKPAA